MQEDGQRPGVAEPLTQVRACSAWAQNMSAAEISPAAASEVGFCPVPPCCCCLVLGCRSCPWAQRAPLRCKQVAVALPLLDFDRLGGESFRALGKLPK